MNRYEDESSGREENIAYVEANVLYYLNQKYRPNRERVRLLLTDARAFKRGVSYLPSKEVEGKMDRYFNQMAGEAESLGIVSERQKAQYEKLFGKNEEEVIPLADIFAVREQLSGVPVSPEEQLNEYKRAHMTCLNVHRMKQSSINTDQLDTWIAQNTESVAIIEKLKRDLAVAYGVNEFGDILVA